MKSKLALHTTSGELGLSIADDTQKTRSQSWNLGRDLGKYLHQKLAKFIEPSTWQDLEFIAVAKGPGSYTSTRIGIITAKTLAQQLNIPVYGISTLEILAWEEAKKSKVENILVQMKANREEVFVGLYQLKQNKYLSTISSDKIINNQQWEEELSSYKTKFEDNYKLVIAPDKLGFTAQSLLEIATIKYEQEKLNDVFSTWENLTPFYQ